MTQDPKQPVQIAEPTELVEPILTQKGIAVASDDIVVNFDAESYGTSRAFIRIIGSVDVPK